MKNIITLAIAITISASIFAGGYKTGDVARDFSLKNVDGKMVSLSDMKSAKGFIVVFTCNHCPFAKAYEGRIMDLDKKYSSKGYPVIAINPNDVSVVPEDAFDKMAERAKDKGYTFPYLYDESQDIAIAYGAVRTPHVFVLNKENDKLIVKYIGAIDNNSDEPAKADQKYVEYAVNALLAGKGIPVTETKAIGCGIKWKASAKTGN